jgi:hypothetical protein
MVNQNIIDRYNAISKKKTYKQPPIQLYEPVVIEKDYKIGFIYRYFIRKRNEPNGIIYEINSDTQRKYKNDALFITTSIRWKINGEQWEAETANKKSINLGKLDISNLDTYVKNLSLFWKG